MDQFMPLVGEEEKPVVVVDHGEMVVVRMFLQR